MKRSITPVSNTWKSSYTKTFAQSTLGTLLQKPNNEVVKTLNEKTLALKMMSLDLSSSGKFFSATTKGNSGFFPSTTQSKYGGGAGAIIPNGKKTGKLAPLSP
jgi:hypothetical protein